MYPSIIYNRIIELIQLFRRLELEMEYMSLVLERNRLTRPMQFSEIATSRVHFEEIAPNASVRPFCRKTGRLRCLSTPGDPQTLAFEQFSIVFI